MALPFQWVMGPEHAAAMPPSNCAKTRPLGAEIRRQQQMADYTHFLAIGLRMVCVVVFLLLCGSMVVGESTQTMAAPSTPMALLSMVNAMSTQELISNVTAATIEPRDLALFNSSIHLECDGATNNHDEVTFNIEDHFNYPVYNMRLALQLWAADWVCRVRRHVTRDSNSLQLMSEMFHDIVSALTLKTCVLCGGGGYFIWQCCATMPSMAVSIAWITFSTLTNVTLTLLAYLCSWQLWYFIPVGFAVSIMLRLVYWMIFGPFMMRLLLFNVRHPIIASFMLAFSNRWFNVRGGRLIVSLIVFKYWCDSMPKVVAMDPGSTGGHSSILYIETLSEQIWLPFAAMLDSFAHMAKSGETYGRPIDERRPAVGANADDATVEDVKEWDRENELLFYRLRGVTAKCAEAQLILNKHKLAKDGRSALLEMESTAMGSQTGESAEGLLTRLLTVDPGEHDMRSMLQLQYQIVQRIKAFPHVTMDDIFKFHMLKLVRNHTDALLYAPTEERCSAQGVSYEKTYTAMLEATARRV
jgi:hypothetical protein